MSSPVPGISQSDINKIPVYVIGMVVTLVVAVALIIMLLSAL